MLTCCLSLGLTGAGMADGTAPSSQTASTSNVVAAVPDNSRLARLLAEARYSAGVREVARMADSGVDTTILTAHVIGSEIPYKLRVEDVTHLRESGVPDSVITAMIDRGTELRSKASPAPRVQWVDPAPPAPTVVFVPAPRPPPAPASTVTVIGGSNIQRGLSYRNYYYSYCNYRSPRTYGSVYASFGNYKGYSRCAPRRVYSYRGCR